MRKLRLVIFMALFIPMTSGAVLLPLGWGLALVTGVTTASLILPLTAASLVVGAALSWVTIGGTPAATADTSAILVQVDPKAPLPTPAGWTDPVAPSPKPTPPSTIAETSGTSSAHPNAGYPSQPYPGFAAACAGGTNVVYWDSSVTGSYKIYARHTQTGYPEIMNNSANLGNCNTTPTTYVSTKSLACPAGKNYQHPELCVSAPSCPAGYTGPSSGNCTLTNAAIVQKPSDSRCYIVRNGNTYSADSQDPDCAAGLPAEFQSGPNSITWGGKGNGDGGGSIIIDPATGETTITGHKQNGDGTTTTTKIQAGAANPTAAPGAGVSIKGISENTVKGVGSLVTGSAPGSIELPTDYNRETTQQAMKKGVDDLNAKLDATGADTSLSSTKSGYDSAVADHKAKIDALAAAPLNNHGIAFTFSPIIPSTACYEPEVNVGAYSFTMTWCDKIEMLKQVFAWVFFILTGFGIFNMVTSREN